MNNREWLYSLDVADLADWFDAEHVEHQEQALDGDTEPENEDSRDKLGADAKRYIEYAACDARTDVLWADETFTLLDAVIELLDRQAAITERECIGDVGKASMMGIVANERECYGERIAELTAERDNWKEHSRTIEYRCKKAETDCGIYRKKFGKCIDYADAIHALMDDEGMA